MKEKSTRHLPGLVWGLLIFTVIYRVIASQFPDLSNTSPTMALCFGGGLMLGRRFWWIPAALVFISDLAIGLINGGGGVGTYSLMTAALFCAAAWMGSLAGRRFENRSWFTNFLYLWSGALLCSVIFYLAANTFAWAAYPGYAKSIAGWMQSQTTGLPGFPPSWMFLRNMIIGDTAWCFVAGVVFVAQAFFENDKKVYPVH